MALAILNRCSHLRLNAQTIIASQTRCYASTVPKHKLAKPKTFIGWKSVAALTGTGVAILACLKYELSRKKSKSSLRDVKVRADYLGIGGPFELTDYDGKPFKSVDHLGKWMLIYFGFTHCPDVCPEEIDKMIEAVRQESSFKQAKTKSKVTF